MSVLLDTNVVIWWLEESPRLGARARDVIMSEYEVVVSDQRLRDRDKDVDREVAHPW